LEAFEQLKLVPGHISPRVYIVDDAGGLESIQLLLL